MEFKITGLPMAEFAAILRLGRPDLRAAGITSCVGMSACLSVPHYAQRMPGKKCCLSYAHQRAGTPYDSSGPIFIRRNATATASVSNAVPDQQRRRLLSVRAYDARHSMVDAEVAPGTELESLIDRFFADPRVSYLHVHNARRGCYACA
jgi:hypothetical protein